MEPAEVVDRKGSTGVVLTVFKHCVNTGDKDWLWLQFSFIHYLALDVQREPKVSEKLSSGFEFGGLGCLVGLGISREVCFIKHAEPLVSLLLHFRLSFKALFPSVFPKSHQPLMCWTQLSGPGSRVSPCAQEVMPVTSVIQKKILPTSLPGPLKGTSSKGEMKKISPHKRPDCSYQESWPSGSAVCKAPTTHGVMHDAHDNSPVFQEDFQFPGGFPVFISYRSWCIEPQRSLIQSLRTWACCPWPKNSQILQLAVGVMKPGISPVCFWLLFPWVGSFRGSFFIFLSIPWHLSLPLLLWPLTRTSSTLPWVSQLGSKEVTTCQLVPSYLVTVCSPKGIFGLGLCVCEYMCVFYMLYFYHRKDRQYIMSSVEEVTH